jgi:hypothetical protein
MKPASAKNKGRILQKLVRTKLIETFDLQPADVHSTSMGAGGEDLKLSPYARIRFPYSVECKSLARVAVYQYYWQALDNAGGHTPLVVVKQNNAPPLAILSLDDFLKVVKEATK